MIKKVLIANRGEIALRILRACHEMGIKTVAVHSTADDNAMHVRLADESVCIGPPQITQSYLNIPSILSACEITGADAVHPGYGFLSENAKFAEIIKEHNIIFIGPTSEHIELMGNKIKAKNIIRKLGIPCVPDSKGIIKNDNDALNIADKLGYPVIIKPVAGGGGIGMRVVENKKNLISILHSIRKESKIFFKNDSIYVEKFLNNPRHIEIQIIGDKFGNIVHLGERDCSLQRRHQKIWEETRSPILSNKQYIEISEIVVKAMSSINYLGVGTIEFLFENGKFYFIEMNTRLQVEHPITEVITGIDLVHEQINIANGNKLSFNQSKIKFNGHVIECRINAEDYKTFIPSSGKIENYHTPGGFGVRVDSGVYSGYTIPSYYDSLIGKLIVHGKNRKECLMRLRRALKEFIIEGSGIKTTIPLFKKLVLNSDILNGDYNINWLEKYLKEENL